MDKHAETHAHKGILISSKKDTCFPMDESQIHYAKWKKLASKCYVPHATLTKSKF